jgi:hypothetical protein
LPGLRFAFFSRPGRDSGAMRPGRSSADGGIEEFPEFRDAARSSRANRADSSAFAASSSPAARRSAPPAAR